jgi:hypothetical protein
MRWFRVVPGVLVGVALCQIPAFADGTFVGVCNGGKAEFDAYLVAGGTTYTKHVKPAECVDWAKSEGQMAPATIGIGFTDPKGQYVGAKRFDRVPNWNGPLDGQFGLPVPVVLKAAHTTLTVKHEAASVTIPGLLAFQAQPVVCTNPAPDGGPQLYMGMSMAQIRRAQSQYHPVGGPQERVCTYPSYGLTAIAYPDTHEVAFDEECYSCEAAEQAKLTPETRAKDEETQKSIDEGLRRLLVTLNLGGADGARMNNLMDQTLKDDEAAPARRREMAKGPYSMDWEHLSTFVVSAFSRAKPLMYNRHIILRGTVSKVVPPKQGAEIPRYVLYFKEGSTLTKAPLDLPGDYFIQQYVGREDAFAICAVDGAVLGDVFGASYATAAVGKMVEMEGELNSGTCAAAVGIHVDLAHQVKVVTASTPATKGQTFQPKFGPAPAGPGPAAPIADLGGKIGAMRDNAAAAGAAALFGLAGPPTANAGRAGAAAPAQSAAATPPPAPDMDAVNKALAARGLAPNAPARGAQQPVTTASVAPVRPAVPASAPAGPATPATPPAPKRDPLIDQILNQLKQGGNEAAVLRALKGKKAVTLTDADKAELRAAGATDAVIAALLDPSTIPLTPQEQRMAAQQAESQTAAQKLAACLAQAMKDNPTDRQANVKAQVACRTSR